MNRDQLSRQRRLLERLSQPNSAARCGGAACAAGALLAEHAPAIGCSRRGRLGLAEAPVIRLEHLSEAQRRAYLIADNRLAEQGKWSDELLTAELAWLRTRASTSI